ncbi:TPA: recombinase family protein [Bacillus cereus]|nr:recombinase family protein [Bacillus cereus]
MRNIGYVRGNEGEENLAEQMHTLQQVKIDILYQEKASGADNNWLERGKLLQDLQKGDTIWVTSLTHFISSTADLCEMVAYMQEKGAYLQSVKDTWLDLSADNPHRSSVLLVMEGVLQLERELFRMRQREGIELAKQEGKYTGREKTYHAEHPRLQEALELYVYGDMTVREICTYTQVSQSTLYRHIHAFSIRMRT